MGPLIFEKSRDVRANDPDCAIVWGISSGGVADLSHAYCLEHVKKTIPPIGVRLNRPGKTDVRHQTSKSNGQ